MDIVENRFKHLVKEFWQRDAALREKEGRSVAYADFKRMLSRWINILSSRRPHVKLQSEQPQLEVSSQAEQQRPEVVVNSTYASNATADQSPSRPLSMVSCNVCRSLHPTEDCDYLWSLSMSEKSSKLKQLRLCFHCLQPGHVHRRCPAPPGCKMCPAFHHTVFHGRQTGSRNLDTEGASQRGGEEEEEAEGRHVHVSDTEGSSG